MSGRGDVPARRSCSMDTLSIMEMADMFDFLRRHFGGTRAVRHRTEQARPGVQLLASVLVCFPEIQAVSYEPHIGLLTMDFVLRGTVSEDEMEAFAEFLAESIETYQGLEGGMASEMEFTYEHHEGLMMLHLARRMDEVTEREIGLTVQLLTDRFGEALLVDVHGADVPDAEFRQMQHDALDRMLTAVREMPLRDRLVGIRERDQVVVYNR